jgi:polysaccharide pyruvyl transferase WcaK-like protein
MEKVLFSGYYGELNTGDDAFCCVASWGAKKYWHTKEIGFFSHLIPTGIDGRPIFTSNKSLFPGYRSIESTVKTTLSWPNVVFAGGSVFHDDLNIYRKYLQQMGRRKRLRVGAIGVSLGPFKSIKAFKENEEFLKSFSFLALRDKKSFEIAAEMNLPYKPILAFDLAALMPEICPVPVKSEEILNDKVLGVSVCHYERYHNGDIENEKRREKQALRLIIEARKQLAFRVRLFVFNGNSTNGDAELTREFAGELAKNNINVEIIPYSLDTYATWLKIAECDAVLAIRLHAGIFSCFANVPFMMIEYHRKCGDFLDDIGYPDKYRIGDITGHLNEAVIGLQEMLYDNGTLQLDVAALTRKAEQSFTNVDIKCNY